MTASKPTNADIDEARRRMRAENGGHEPYAPVVYGRALEIVNERLAAERDALLAACEGCGLAISHRWVCPTLAIINEGDHTDAASLARGMDAADPGSTDANAAAGTPQAGQEECARADIGDDCRCLECVERRAANNERAAEWAEDAQGEERS